MAIVVASYVGSIFLDYFDVRILTFIAIIIWIASIIPLFLMKFKHEREDIKIELIKHLKEIPKKDMYLFGSYELLYVVKCLFSLYLVIYVKNTYQTVGIINLLTNLSIMIFSYSYGKRINGDKNFLKLGIILTVIIYLCKANCTSYWLILISFLEGMFTKMYELSINKEFYALSKKFEYYNYNLVYEIAQNSCRTIAVLIMFLFINNIKLMIYLILAFMLFGMFLTFERKEEKEEY